VLFLLILGSAINSRYGITLEMFSLLMNVFDVGLYASMVSRIVRKYFLIRFSANSGLIRLSIWNSRDLKLRRERVFGDYWHPFRV
jgi:hypothetical protein